MFEISVESSFAAAHFLRGYPGNCEKIHGHNWKVRATARVRKLNRLGFGLDFREFQSILRDVTGQLDHQNLNELRQFRKQNPSAENIARWIFENLEGRLRRGPAKLKGVQVWESETNAVIYEER